MNHADALQDIMNKISNTSELIQATQSHWVILFCSNDTGLLHGYDARDPVRGFQALTKTHPELEYLDCIPCNTRDAALEYVKVFSTYAKIWRAVQTKRSRTPRASVLTGAPAGAPAEPSSRASAKPAGTPPA